MSVAPQRYVFDQGSRRRSLCARKPRSSLWPFGGFISDFNNSHDISPTPEPATLLLLGSALTGMRLAWRRRRGASLKYVQSDRSAHERRVPRLGSRVVANE
jgi:hypothetical protein